jgi:FtsZ-binding cell division protein ZapB
MSYVRECKRDRDEKAVGMEELEEKVASLDKDCKDLIQERIAMKEKSKVIKKDHVETQQHLTKLGEERLKLQDLLILQ